MQNTYLENTIISLGEFFARIDIPLKESGKMASDIVELALLNLLGEITALIPPEEAPTFSSLLDSPGQTEEQRFALFWEKALAFLGEEHAEKMFAASLKETLADYMESMEKRLNPAQKEAVREFKLREVKLDIENTLG